MSRRQAHVGQFAECVRERVANDMTVPTWSDDAKSAAGKLLNASPSRPEDNIRQDIVRLLIALGIEEFTLTYRTSAGEADIYMQRRRVFFETKKVGLADHPHRPQARKTSESPFGQLKRYLEAEMKDELGRLPLGKQPTLAWTGIVTDGRVWHAWRFPHAPGSTPTDILDGFRPRNENELLCKIEPLLNATPVGKPWIPADPVPVFDGRLETLREIHAGMSGRVLQTTETKMLLWLDMLRGSGMAPNSTNAQARLFTAHCFLVALARGVVHTLLNPDIKPDSKKLLGNGYPAWILSVENGRKWAQELLETVHGYEWRRRAGDVLRPLYERFVDSSDRHSFGEVYTPDWLAEMMVEEVLDGKWCDQAVLAALADLRGLGKLDGIGVLDPTCGSGTFLYHCARRILANPKVATLQAVQQADVVCRLVHGIDIHPVAIEFCKATILRALPAPPTAGDLAPAIYQGDSLMLRQTEKETLFDPRDGEIVIRSPGGIQIVIPRAFSEHMEFSDMMRRMVDAAAEGSELPEDISAVMGSDKEKVKECHRALMDVIRAEGNSVWTWYITNVLGPDRLSRQKVNRVVANPPWVKMSNIQVPDRKRGLERLAGKETTMGSLDLWVGGTQAPHLDIAQLFVRRTRETYLKEPHTDPAAWVLKVSAIRAGNWEKFRNWHYKYLAHALDLTNVKVFGGGDARRSCVLFENRRSSIRAEGDDSDAVQLLAECPKSVPEASMPWSSARKLIDWKKPKVFPKKPSHYSEDGWRVGATVLPRVLTMVDREKLELGGGGGASARRVTTVRSDKPPWNELVPRTGNVPLRWLTPLLTSNQLLPFRIAPSGPDMVIVPQDKDGDLLSTKKARQTEFWEELDDLYREHRGIGANTPKTLIDQINYSNKLSAQMPLHAGSKYMVIYPKSGDIMRGAFIREGDFAMDSGVYRRPVAGIMEARFLIAILNAPALTETFKYFRESGRDFQKSSWRSVPIPEWDESNSVHQDLAALSERAEETALAMSELPARQIAASRRVREQLTEDGTFNEIDTLVRVILPEHVG